MKKMLLLLTILWLTVPCLFAQVEPDAGKWKTWFIASGKDVQLPAPPNVAASKQEIKAVLAEQEKRSSAHLQRILY